MAPLGFLRRTPRSGTTSRTTTAPSSPNTATSPTFATAPRLPEAMPCHNYYDIYPEDAGPVGHVVIDSREDMRVWRLIAKPISAEEAMEKGGCLQYVSGSAEAKPRYYEFAPDASEVYGSATYQPSAPESPLGEAMMATQVTQDVNKHVDAQSDVPASAIAVKKTASPKTVTI